MSFSKLLISSEGFVEIETRIFLDDLSAHMEHRYRLRKADFSTLTTNGTLALQRYLHEHFYFEQGGQKNTLIIKAVGLSKNKLSLVAHLKTAFELDLQQPCTLRYSLLCDAFEKQKNDLLFRGDHYLLDAEAPTLEIPL